MSNISDVLLDTKINNNKTYIVDDIDYYKVLGMNNQYYIKVIDYYQVSLSQKPVELYRHSIYGLEKVKGYIKSIDSSDILLIAAPSISSHFKMFDLEKVPCTR